jgi:hypothetical protein
VTADVLLAACCSITSLGFAALVGGRCLERSAGRPPLREAATNAGRTRRPERQPALILWSIGLLWYALSTATQALGSLNGWDAATYRWWYLSGAFYTAAFLGMGSIYLVAPRQVAHAIMACLAIGSLMVAPLVLLAPVDASRLPTPGEAPSGQAIHSAVRMATPVFNVFGAGALFLGALWGAWHFWHSHRGARAVANLLIACGALVPSFASGFTRFGLTASLAFGQLLGLLLILGGFLLAMRRETERARDAKTDTQSDPAPRCGPGQRFREHRADSPL